MHTEFDSQIKFHTVLLINLLIVVGIGLLIGFKCCGGVTELWSSHLLWIFQSILWGIIPESLLLRADLYLLNTRILTIYLNLRRLAIHLNCRRLFIHIHLRNITLNNKALIKTLCIDTLSLILVADCTIIVLSIIKVLSCIVLCRR